MKKFLTLCSVVLLGLSICNVTFAQQEDNDTELLQVVTIEREPFSYTDKDRLQGFSVDLRKAVAKKLNLEYEFTQEIVFAEMLGQIEEKKADVAVANISVTPERKQVMEFSTPIFDSGLILLAQKQSGLSLRQMLLQSGFVMFLIVLAVAVLVGLFMGFKDGGWKVTLLIVIVYLLRTWFTPSMYHKMMNDDYVFDEDHLHKVALGAANDTTMSRYLDREGISYTTYADFTDSLAGLAKGEIDFVVADAAVGRYYAQHDGRRTVQVVGETFAPDQIAFAFPKGSSLTEDVNSALEWVKKEGTFEVLKYRYFGE